MKSALAYRRKDRWFIHSESKTTAGVWIASPPYFESDSNPVQLGEAIIKALGCSSEGVRHPTEWGTEFAPILALAGVKSWKTFMKGVSLVSAELDGASITITPHRNDGPQKGFIPILDGRFMLSDLTPFNIGSAVMQTMLASE